MKKLLLIATLAASASAFAFTQNFNDVTTLGAAGWSTSNQSGTAGNLSWFQGNPNVITAHQGPENSYIGVNFQSGAGATTISNWLLTPEVNLVNGSTLSFWTITSAPIVADRLQVRMSTNGASTNTGSGPSAVGDFTSLLLDINPNYLTDNNGYPGAWTQFNINVTGLGAPTSGRFAFRYFVEDGGPLGTRSNYIGIDTANYTEAVPEPATLLVLGGLAAAAARRKRK